MRRSTRWLSGLTLALLAVGASQSAAGQDTSGTPVPPKGTRWVVDIVHSQIDFRVRHLVGRVRGTFTNWYAVLLTEDHDWRHGRINVTVQTTSLNTGNSLRDTDLRSKRFFFVDSFPEMTFLGTGIAAGDTTVEIVGLMTIKGHTRPVTLKGQYHGIAADNDGHERIAFDATAVLDRRDFGIDWNTPAASGTLIGNEVEITIALEAVRVK